MMSFASGSALAVVVAGLALTPSRANGQVTYSKDFALGEVGSQVSAMLVWDDDGPGPRPVSMFVGGDFTNAGGVPASRVARWDGQNWSALGTGMSGGGVFALAAFDDDGPGPNPERLYAAGAFTSAGGNAVERIARWDGTTWSALPGGGLNSQVNTLCVYKGQLFAGGFFTQANPSGTPVSATGLASFNGTGWTGRSVGSTTVYALVVHDDGQGGGSQLYVGGTFSSVPGVTGGSRIARFNGAVFSDVGGGMSGSVNGGASGPRVTSLAVHNGQLYAGGAFANAGSASGVNSVARWDGLAWNGLSGGVTVADSNGAKCMVSYAPPGQAARLYVGGNFTAVGLGGAVAANRIAAYDGVNWSALGTGLNSLGPNALCVYPPSGAGASIQAGGNFASAGGFPAVNMGRWDGTRWTTLGGGFKTTASGSAVRVIKGRIVPQAPAERGTAAGQPPPQQVVFGLSALMYRQDDPLPSNLWLEQLGDNPFRDIPPGDSAGAVLDAEFTHEGNVVCTGAFTQCGGLPAAGLGFWDRGQDLAVPFGAPGIVGGNAAGRCIIDLPSDPDALPAYRICTDAFEIGGQNIPWGATWQLDGSDPDDFTNGTFVAPVDDQFPTSSDGPITEEFDFNNISYDTVVSVFAALASPPAQAGNSGKVKVLGGNYSSLVTQNRSGERTAVGNAYVNFVDSGTGAVFGPGQPPTGPCTALAWCPKSFADKTGFIVVAGGPFAIAGYNGTNWATIGNARNGGFDGLVGDIAFFNADNDPEWEMVVGGTITSVQQGGVTVASCRNLVMANATGVPGQVTWSNMPDSVTGVEGADNTVWDMELALVTPPGETVPRATLMVGGQFRSAGGWSAGRLTAIHGAQVPPACFSDFNDDGMISTPDLTFFLGRFGSASTSGAGAFRADFNRDGTVNTPDLVFFLGRFGQTCP